MRREAAVLLVVLVLTSACRPEPAEVSAPLPAARSAPASASATPPATSGTVPSVRPVATSTAQRVRLLGVELPVINGYSYVELPDAVATPLAGSLPARRGDVDNVAVKGVRSLSGHEVAVVVVATYTRHVDVGSRAFERARRRLADTTGATVSEASVVDTDVLVTQTPDGVFYSWTTPDDSLVVVGGPEAQAVLDVATAILEAGAS